MGSNPIPLYTNPDLAKKKGDVKMPYSVWKCSICDEEFSTQGAAEKHELEHAPKLIGLKYLSDGKMAICSVNLIARGDECELRFSWIAITEHQSAKYSMDMKELADAVNALSVDKCINEDVIETVITPETGTSLPDESQTV